MPAFQNITGNKINNWLVIEHKGFNKQRASLWLVECQCYKHTRVIRNIQQIKKNKSCGCRNLPDLTGSLFGRWKVLRWVEGDMWECECSCGKETNKILDGRALRGGKSKSCGCLTIEACKKHNIYNLDGDYGIGYTTNKNDEFNFDLEDYNKIKNTTWITSTDEYIVGSSGSFKNKRMHRILFNDLNEDIPIDHINRNRKDNRKCNIRMSTNQENSFNGSLRINNTSGVIGVSWWKRDDNWLAQIKCNYKRIYLGYYDDFEEAVRARLNAELKYFGIEYAPQRHLFDKYNIGGDLY